MTDELPDDIELPLAHWESGERDQARARWEELRHRPGTIGRLAEQCLELADRGVDTIRTQLGPLPSPDELGWEEMLLLSSDDEHELELLDDVSALPLTSSPTGTHAEPPRQDTPAPAPAPTPREPEAPSSVDLFFAEAFDLDSDTHHVTAEQDADALEAVRQSSLDEDERPPSAQRLQMLAPDDDDDDEDDFGDNFFEAADNTRRREATGQRRAPSDDLDVFFANKTPTRVRDEQQQQQQQLHEQQQAQQSLSERPVSGERRAAAEALTRRSTTNEDSASRRHRPLDEPARSHTPAAPRPAADFLDNLFDNLDDSDDDAHTPLPEPQPRWLGGIEPTREPPQNHTPPNDISAELDDLREIFGSTSRLVEESTAGLEDDPWAELSNELSSAATGPSRSSPTEDHVRPMPSRSTPALDERPRTVPRNRVPTSRPTSRYAPEVAPRPRVSRPESHFPRTKTPVRHPAAPAVERECQRLLDEGNPFAAYIRALQYRQEGEPGLDAFIAVVQEQLLAIAVELIKPLDRCPVLRISPADIPSLKNIDHRGGYLLSQIDGMITIEFLIELGAMPRAEAALLLLTLADRGIIALDG